jgi:hypothetical protein
MHGHLQGLIPWPAARVIPSPTSFDQAPPQTDNATPNAENAPPQQPPQPGEVSSHNSEAVVSETPAVVATPNTEMEVLPSTATDSADPLRSGGGDLPAQNPGGHVADSPSPGDASNVVPTPEGETQGSGSKENPISETLAAADPTAVTEAMPNQEAETLDASPTVDATGTSNPDPLVAPSANPDVADTPLATYPGTLSSSALDGIPAEVPAPSAQLPAGDPLVPAEVWAASAQLPPGDPLLAAAAKAREAEGEALRGLEAIRDILQKNSGLAVREMRLVLDYPGGTYRAICAALLAVGRADEDLRPWGSCRWTPFPQLGFVLGYGDCLPSCPGPVCRS